MTNPTDDERITPEVRLPSKMSDLLELAISDARKLDRERYEPYWAHWHEPKGPTGKTCMVCLAGAVIAGTLGANHSIGLDIEDFNDETANQLDFLDDMRSGMFRRAIEKHIGLEIDLRNQEDYYVGILKKLDEEYDDSAGDFTDWESFDVHLENMETIVEVLREHDL